MKGPNVALALLAGVCVLGMIGIAVLQISLGHPVDIPAPLVSVTSVAFTALFGQGIFFGHTAATAALTAIASGGPAASTTTPKTTPSSPPAVPSVTPSAPPPGVSTVPVLPPAPWSST